ncbi:MAG: hypothetical protein LUO82_01110 [Methanomicrobiales archaeon]|nr:hypothetical protein [Methanomicrobiales archaeon]
MHRSLRWKDVGIEEKLERLHSCVIQLLQKAPPARSSEREKFTRWGENLQELRRKIADIREQVLPLLERDLGNSLVSGEILFLALFQPSTRNLFSEIEVHLQRGGTCALTPLELGELALLPESAKTLAWVGDAALSLAVLNQIWVPSITRVGELTEKRKEYVQNTNLARLCDRWELYEHRLHLDPPSDPTTLTRETVDHLKGTLVEAIFGILFLAGGVTAVADAIPLLQPPHQKES